MPSELNNGDSVIFRREYNMPGIWIVVFIRDDDAITLHKGNDYTTVERSAIRKKR